MKAENKNNKHWREKRPASHRSFGEKRNRDLKLICNFR